MRSVTQEQSPTRPIVIDKRNVSVKEIAIEWNELDLFNLSLVPHHETDGLLHHE